MLSACTFLAATTFAESLWSPEDTLRKERIEEFSFSNQSPAEVADSIESLAEKKGIKLKVEFRSDPPNLDFFKEGFSAQNIDLYLLLRIIFGQDALAIDVFAEDRASLFEVCFYERIGVNSLSIISTLPAVEEPFSEYFSSDVLSGKNKPKEALWIEYTRKTDLLGINSSLNRLIARGAMLTERMNFPEEIGFLAHIKTNAQSVYIVAGKEEIQFVGLDVSAVNSEDIDWLLQRLYDMLPEEYRLRMDELTPEYYNETDKNQSAYDNEFRAPRYTHA